MRKLILMLSCAVALCAVGCASSSSEPQPAATTGSETAALTVEAPPAPAEPAPAPVAEAAPAPAEPAAPPPPAMPSTSVMVFHKVKDFDAWKPGFDGHEQARREGGIKAHAVMREVKNPNNIGLWMPTEDAAKFAAMVASPEMKKTMKDAGVIGKPTVSVLKYVEMAPAKDGPGKYGVFIDHKVKDFTAWKAGFDAHAQTRSDAGFKGGAVAQDPSDPNHVYVWLVNDDLAKIEAFTSSKDLKAKMKEAGVVGKPKLTVVENIEFKMYP